MLHMDEDDTQVVRPTRQTDGQVLLRAASEYFGDHDEFGYRHWLNTAVYGQAPCLFLDLSGGIIDELGIKIIASTSVNLRALDLTAVSNGDDDGSMLMPLIKSGSQVQFLGISSWFGLRDCWAIELCSGLENLKVMQNSHCSRLTMDFWSNKGCVTVKAPRKCLLTGIDARCPPINVCALFQTKSSDWLLSSFKKAGYR